MTNEFILHQNSPNQILENYFTKVFELEKPAKVFRLTSTRCGN